MAAPAAQLSIVIDANSRAAVAELNRLDTTLRKSGVTATKATRTTGDLDKSTRSLGSRFASAAKYAAGAAAAYLSVAQAKAAVTTTQELANSSAVLSRNLGLTTKQASRWASVAQTRDISTKQLNASFTTLTQKLVDAKGGSEEALEAFRALGITQADLEKDGNDFNATLLRVSDALENAKGGADRQAAATRLLGRGYQTLLPIMGQGSDALREQLALGDKYGATMGKDAVDSQMKLTASLRESERAWQGLQVTFTQAITPALAKANREFQSLSRIMGSDNLTNAEKFDKVAAKIGGWADDAFRAFVGVLPKMVEEAANRAPQIAEALIKGFMQASIWGKVTLAALIGAKLFGGAAISAVGQRVGERLSTTIAQAGMSAGAGPMKSAGSNLGLMFGTAFTVAAVGNAVEGQNAFTEKWESFKPQIALHFTKEWAQRTDELTSKQREAFKQYVKGMEASGEATHAEVRAMLEDIRKVEKEVRKAQDAMGRGKGIGLAKAIAADGKLADGEIKKILKDLKKLPEGARKEAADTLTGMVRAMENKGDLPRGAAEKIRKAVTDKFKDMNVKSVNEAKDMSDRMSDKFSDLGRNLGSLASKAQGSFLPKFLNVFRSITSNLPGILGGISRLIDNFVTNLMNQNSRGSNGGGGGNNRNGNRNGGDDRANRVGQAFGLTPSTGTSSSRGNGGGGGGRGPQWNAAQEWLYSQGGEEVVNLQILLDQIDTAMSMQGPTAALYQQIIDAIWGKGDAWGPADTIAQLLENAKAALAKERARKKPRSEKIAQLLKQIAELTSQLAGFAGDTASAQAAINDLNSTSQPFSYETPLSAMQAQLAVSEAALTDDNNVDDLAALRNLRAEQQAQKDYLTSLLASTSDPTLQRELMGLIQGLNSELASTNSAITSMVEQQQQSQQDLIDAQNAAAAEMKALREAVDQSNRLASSELAVGLTEARRALADMISGQIGSNAYSQSQLAGNGSAVRY